MNPSAALWFRTQAEILLRLSIIENMGGHTEVAERLRNEAIEHERIATEMSEE